MKTQAEKKPFILTQQLETYLATIYTYRFLRADQVTRLFYQLGSLSKVQERLKLLVDHKYLYAFQLPTVKTRSPYIYVVIGKGISYLQEQGIEATAYYRPSQLEELSHGFLWHVLELNDFLISAVRVGSVNPASRLEQMQHDLDLKKTPLKVSYTPLGSEKAKNGTIWPDAWLEFRMSPGDGKKDRVYYFWHEHDRGTEGVKPFKDKLVRILAALQSGKMQEHFHFKTLSGVTFATSAGEKRVAQMQKWTMELVGELKLKRETTELFLFTEQVYQVKKPANNNRLTIKYVDTKQMFFEPVWKLAVKEEAPINLLD